MQEAAHTLGFQHTLGACAFSRLWLCLCVGTPEETV